MPAITETPKTKVVSFRLEKNEGSALKKIASRRRLKISDVCREAVEFYLENYQLAKSKRAA